VALLPKPRGEKVGTRRLAPGIERLLNDVIDTWSAKAEHLMDVLLCAALQGIADKTQKVGLIQLQVVGAKMSCRGANAT
jgi:hypothetical protein